MGLFKSFFGNKGSTLNKVRYSLQDYNIYFDKSNIEDIPLEHIFLGELNILSGKIIACDPLVCLGETEPFTRTVPPGKYPVAACIAKTEKSGDRYAVVKLEFNKTRAVKWEMAVAAQYDVSQLKEEGDFFGFPVDAGLGCFCDANTQDLYSQFNETFYENNPGANIYDDFFAAKFKNNAIDKDDPNDIGDWLNFYLPNKPALNIIMFHSGYGDGVYPCFWGVSDKGEICNLIVDFQVC